MTKWCEIFNTGLHKDSKGNQKLWTKTDLEAIVKNFENKNPDVPICCGHTKSNSPAYGWIDELKVEDAKTDNGIVSKLYASYKQVQEEFKDACQKGLFKTRSISITPDLVLRHVAFLGAQPPAIKGMEQFCFDEQQEAMTYNFDEIEENNADIKEVPSLPPETHEEDKVNPGTKLPLPPEVNKGENMEENQKLQEAQEELKKIQEENQELKKELEERKKEANSKEIEEFCDCAIKEGNILPSQREFVAGFLNSLSESCLNFSEETQQNCQKSFKDFIKNLKQFDFEEIATNKNAPKNENFDFSDPKQIKEAIIKTQNEYQSKGINLTAQEAYLKVKGDYND